MKSLKCDLGDHQAQGETSEEWEEWMEALKPHYGDVHADVMSDASKTKEEMEQWMLENMARFQAV